jgi:hypothetical protein
VDHPPTEPLPGHRLRGPYRALVGSQVCECGTIHRVFHCRTCEASVYRPAPGPECSLSTSTAGVRIRSHLYSLKFGNAMSRRDLG